MDTFTAPSRELASRVLGEVDFEDRFIGGSLHLRGGVRKFSLYSLEEIFMLLREPYPQVDLDRLENWVRTVIHDRELADRMKAVTGQKATEQDALPLIRDLVGLRLIQCKQLT